MNSYQAQLSAALARGAELLTGNLLLAVFAFVALVLLLMWVSRRGEPRSGGEETPVALPARRPPSAGEVGDGAPAPAADTRPALLVVDDSAVARAKLRRLFESAGYRVEIARDGVEALQLLPTARFSLLVTDLEMPNMDGVELIAHVHGSLDTEDLPILAITGHDELQARVHEVEGLYGIFRKPWNDRELLKRVEALASLRPGSARAPMAAPTGRAAGAWSAEPGSGS